MTAVQLDYEIVSERCMDYERPYKKHLNAIFECFNISTFNISFNISTTEAASSTAIRLVTVVLKQTDDFKILIECKSLKKQSFSQKNYIIIIILIIKGNIL